MTNFYCSNDIVFCFFACFFFHRDDKILVCNSLCPSLVMQPFGSPTKIEQSNSLKVVNNSWRKNKGNHYASSFQPLLSVRISDEALFVLVFDLLRVTHCIDQIVWTQVGLFANYPQLNVSFSLGGYNFNSSASILIFTTVVRLFKFSISSVIFLLDPVLILPAMTHKAQTFQWT